MSTPIIIIITTILTLFFGFSTNIISASIEYPKFDSSCKHMPELRYNRNSPIENEVLRRVKELFHIFHPNIELLLLQKSNTCMSILCINTSLLSILIFFKLDWCSLKYTDSYIKYPFLQALQDYEIMHKDSTKTKNPEDVFQKTGTHSKYKYVYAYMDSSGLGNRLLNLVSSFLLALITNRVLVIYSPDYDLREVCFHVIDFDVVTYEYCMYCAHTIGRKR